jgi:SAM-dependent methyltransferase
VIEHVLRPAAVLHEICRVMQPGGVLVLTTPNYAHWVLRALALAGMPPMGLDPRHYTGLFRRAPSHNIAPWRDPHIRFFSSKTITSLLNHAGFTVSIIRSSFVGFPSALAPYLPWPLALPLRALGKLICNLDFLGDHWPSLLAAGLLIKAIKRW